MLLRPVLDSVLAQEPLGIVAHVELNLPFICTRTNTSYVIPVWLEEYFPRVIIKRTSDLGPATKVAPTLLRHAKNPIWVWSIDDDMVYSLQTLAGLINARSIAAALVATRADKRARLDEPGLRLVGIPGLKRRDFISTPLFVLAYDGLDVLDSNGVPYESLHECGPFSFPQFFQGYRSVFYPPMLLLGVERAFERYLELTGADPDCRLSDDIVLSNFLSALGVPRVLVGEKFRGVIQDYAQDLGATSRQSGGHSQRYPRVILALRAAGLLSLAAGAGGPCTT
jgi:hypothetical protein